MKLTAIQVQRTLRQLDADAIPDNHPVTAELCEIFGNHTFFIDDDGLSILEPTTDVTQPGVQVVRVVKLADWSDKSLSSLTPHEPEPTDDVIELGLKH